MFFQFQFKRGKGGAFEIFIYRVPYPKTLKMNIEFSLVCSYLRKIIWQFMPCITTWTWSTLVKKELKTDGSNWLWYLYIKTPIWYLTRSGNIIIPSNLNRGLEWWSKLEKVITRTDWLKSSVTGITPSN